MKKSNANRQKKGKLQFSWSKKWRKQKTKKTFKKTVKWPVWEPDYTMSKIWILVKKSLSFNLPRPIIWVSGTSGDFVVKSRLPPRSGCVTFRQFNPIHKKEPQSSFKFYSVQKICKTITESRVVSALLGSIESSLFLFHKLLGPTSSL